MPGGKAALLVAAADYDDPKLRRLRAPVHDVDALARVLGDPAIGGFDVHTLLDQPSWMVSEQIEGFFADRNLDDLLLVYFSCHGVKDQSGRLHFAATNTRVDRLGSTGISSVWVNEQLDRSRSQRIVVLLDCCYSGAYARGLAPRADDHAHVIQRLQGRGRAIITASDAMEYAYEGDELSLDAGQPSLFTRAVVDGLETGQADRDGDGWVGIEELYGYVYDQVRAATPHQTPTWSAHGVKGELLLARNPHPPPPPIQPAPLPFELRQAVGSELAWQRHGAIVGLRRLLASDRPEVALSATQALRQLMSDDDPDVRAAATTALEPAEHAAHSAPPDAASTQTAAAEQTRPTAQPAPGKPTGATDRAGPRAGTHTADRGTGTATRTAHAGGHRPAGPGLQPRPPLDPRDRPARAHPGGYRHPAARWTQPDASAAISRRASSTLIRDCTPSGRGHKPGHRSPTRQPPRRCGRRCWQPLHRRRRRQPDAQGRPLRDHHHLGRHRHSRLLRRQRPRHRSPTQLPFGRCGRRRRHHLHRRHQQPPGRKVDSSSGRITTVAGTGTPGFSGDDGPATTAQLMGPRGLAVAADGNLYIADFGNHRVRRVGLSSGRITTVAGTGTAGFSGDDGLATAAQLANPTAVAVDAAGNLYIADNGNHRVRRVDPSGVITTVAGTGAQGFSGDRGPAIAAQLNSPVGVAVDTAGSLYIADRGNERVRRVDPSGVIITVAGTGVQGFSGDRGPAIAAQLNTPRDVAVAADGTLYIADYDNHRVRRVDLSSGVITTVAGTG
jgi:hypothetical protein